MPGHPIHSERPDQSLAERLRNTTERATRLVTIRDRLVSDLDTKRSEIAALTGRVEILSKVGELFRALVDQLLVRQVHAIESVVTEGLGSIFQDLGLKFEAEILPKYGKVSVEFMFRQGNVEDPLSIRGKPLDAFGGGPSAVADLILRMMALLRLKRRPLLLLDETLASVSDEYVDATGSFLRQLAGAMQVDVLLVTHKQSFLDHADRAYRCTEMVQADGRHLELKEVTHA